MCCTTAPTRKKPSAPTPASTSCWTSSRRKATAYTVSIPTSRSGSRAATARSNGTWNTPSSVPWTRTTSSRRAVPVLIWTPTGNPDSTCSPHEARALPLRLRQALRRMLRPGARRGPAGGRRRSADALALHRLHPRRRRLPARHLASLDPPRRTRARRLHETSRFVHEDGRWYYLAGDIDEG